MSVFLRPGAWIVVAFVAGSGAGALGLHWVTQAKDPPSAAGAGSETARQRADSSSVEDELADTDPEEPPATVPLDREALRAALAELLAEEEASQEEDSEQGESASEALMRLELAYRAELEAQARREREEAVEASAVESVDDSARAPAERAPAGSRAWAHAAAEEHLDESAGDAAVLPVDARTAANAVAHREETPVTHQRVESAPTALVTPVQPIFFAPIALPPAAEAPARRERQ